MAAPSGSEEKWLLKLLIGHSHKLLAKPKSNGHTHQWTVFLKSPKDAGQPSLDAQLIASVTFHLHPDFPQPQRTVTQPPYQVTESGYAGFAIPITVAFQHCKKEYSLEYDMNLTMKQTDKRTVERVLEFRGPRSSLRHQLLRFGGQPRKKEKPLAPPHREAKEPETRASPKAPSAPTKAPPALDETLMGHLLKAVGADEGLAKELRDQEPAAPSSPIFRTESSDDEDLPPPPKARKRKRDEGLPTELKVEVRTEARAVKREPGEALSEAKVAELKALQRRIMTLDGGSRTEAQAVADIVTDAGLYQLSRDHLEFDLCALPPSAIAKLEHALELNTS